MTFLWIYPGMIPILHSSAVITPGQFGPTKRVFFLLSNALTMSTTGICSVIQITISKSASAASKIESARMAPEHKLQIR